MAKVKVFEKKVKLQGQCHQVKKKYGMMWKVLSNGIHLWNMKVLSFVVHKLWPRLKFLSTDDDDNNNKQRRRQQRRGYDNSYPDFRHGELKIVRTLEASTADHWAFFEFKIDRDMWCKSWVFHFIYKSESLVEFSQGNGFYKLTMTKVLGLIKRM